MRHGIASSALFVCIAGLAFAQDKEFKRYDVSPVRRALEGKPALPFSGKDWFNTGGRVLDWKALRGNVVVIDFWAHW